MVPSFITRSSTTSQQIGEEETIFFENLIGETRNIPYDPETGTFYLHERGQYEISLSASGDIFNLGLLESNPFSYGYRYFYTNSQNNTSRNVYYIYPLFSGESYIKIVGGINAPPIQNLNFASISIIKLTEQYLP